ncbi:hypothetical protein NLU13_8788 [Sarocladium strictum]|uniref:Uncharacterized protein n=1 Tax=Sarocladium strictum TaxID=5046 RepID=A0AA39GB38_SARSR|nr:hypothetical protein NLU13_8788 [Sarocladium strictum]
MLIPSAKGTNSRGQHVGPSTTNWILGLDLDEVSTIADGPSGSLTRQLELSDLGTNCPQSVDPTAIATLSDSRCAPILAAPTTVSSWAYPCNACGRFGLFDPPYAVPTVTGLIEPTSTTAAATTTRETTTAVTTAPPITTTTTTTTSAAEPTGTIYVVYHEDGQPKSTETLQSAGISGDTTRSVALPPSPSPSLSSSESSTPVPVPDGTTETSEVLEPPTITPTAAPSTLPTPSDPDTITAAAHRGHSGSGPVHAAIAIAFSIVFLFSLY